MRALFTILRAGKTAADLRDHAIISLLRYCGLRASEACNLRLDDLREDEESLYVRGGKSRYAKREIPLIPPCPQMLSLYLARGRRHLLRGYSDHIFLTTDGTPMTRNSLRQMLRRRGAQTGFPLSAHRFRHTWATAHVRARTSPPTIGHLAGWSPKTLFEMLQNYGHPDIDDLRAAQRTAFR
jgi:integrase/recombinase XerD